MGYKGNEKYELSRMDRVLDGIEKMSQQMGLIYQAQQNTQSDVLELKKNYKNLESRMDGYEDRLTIDHWQKSRMIKAKDNAVHRNPDRVLHFEYDNNGNLTPSSCRNKKRYASMFHSRFWKDAQRHAHCARPYDQTLKKDYEEVMAYADTWEPEFAFNGHTGAEALVAYIDAIKDGN